MIQNIIYKGFLIAGISLFLVLISGCGETEYLVKARYIYINDSQYQIECISADSFNLLPFEEHIIEKDGFGNKNITADSYYPPFLGAVMIYDSIMCDTLNSFGGGKGEGVIGIQNYQSRQLGERYYEFTYHFTEEDFNKAENCE